MIWNVIIKVGINDTYVPKFSEQQPSILASIDRPGDPSEIRNNVIDEIIKNHTNKITSSVSWEAWDLLNLAMAVYTADLKTPRNLTEDRWTRNFKLHIPVVNIPKWDEALPFLVKSLEFLTGDRWEICLRQREVPENWKFQERTNSKVAVVSLFSGGLDSLVGAIDLLEDRKSIGLVGHHGAGITNSIQQAILGKLQECYKNLITPYMFYIQPRKRRGGGSEPSMRSRSMLFLSLGILVANAYGSQIPLVVAENGLISLNVPLTNSRMGSLSTRTTHPHFISLYQQVVSSLGLLNTIQMPYKFYTKGEMLANARNQEILKDTVDLTMSCSHPEVGRFRQGTPRKHCGYCVPCIIRRAALSSVKLDNDIYNIDILKEEQPFDREVGRDVRAFQMAIERGRYLNYQNAVFDVLSSGPISVEDIKSYADVYSRGMSEVKDFFSKANHLK